MPARKKPARKTASKGKRTAPKAAARTTPRPKAARPDLPIPSGWTVERGSKRMSRDLRTKDFLEAVEVITALAPLAEALDHHPDFHLEKWNHLRITTWSHDVGGLSERDVRLAERFNEELRSRGWT